MKKVLCILLSRFSATIIYSDVKYYFLLPFHISSFIFHISYIHSVDGHIRFCLNGKFLPAVDLLVQLCSTRHHDEMRQKCIASFTDL